MCVQKKETKYLSMVDCSTQNFFYFFRFELCRTSSACFQMSVLFTFYFLFLLQFLCFLSVNIILWPMINNYFFLSLLRTCHGLQDPARACYGPKHVEVAHERLAVQTLLITDDLFRCENFRRGLYFLIFPAKWHIFITC